MTHKRVGPVRLAAPPPAAGETPCAKTEDYRSAGAPVSAGQSRYVPQSSPCQEAP